MHIKEEKSERHTLSVIVDNEAGILARIAGLFSSRGYNIESLTVSETEHEAHLSRITIVTRGTPSVLEQIKALSAQIDRQLDAHADATDIEVRAQAESVHSAAFAERVAALQKKISKK